MDKEKIIKIIESSKNRLEVLVKLGWNTQTNGYRRLDKFIKNNSINTFHFESIAERMKRIRSKQIIKPKYDLAEILVVDSNYINTTTLKNRLYKEGFKEKKCELCGQTEMWRGRKLSLILDHINGVYDDNRIENLRIVCPNCNATLDTHCGKNKKYKKQPKEKLGYTKDVYIKNHFNQRKTKRPPKETLDKEIKNHGFAATSRKYGVSDNTIRKWVIAYEKYGM